MSRDDGDSPVRQYKIWIRSYFKVGRAKPQARLIAEAVDRARTRVVQLLRDSEGYQDPSVRTDALDRFDADASMAVIRFAGALLGQLEAIEETQRSLKVKLAEQRYRISGAVLLGIAALTLGSIADIGSGPGGIDSINAGWREDLVSAAGLAGLIAAALGIWAAVVAYFDQHRDHMNERQEILKQEDSRLTQNIDAALETEWVQPIIAKVLGDQLGPPSLASCKW